LSRGQRHSMMVLHETMAHPIEVGEVLEPGARA
jgi:hypothetical protein